MFTDEQLTSQCLTKVTDFDGWHDFKDKSNEAATCSNLEFPRIPDHQVKISVLVDGGGDAAVVIQELFRCDLAIAHSVRGLQLEKW